jgi:hypothetical protein
VEGFVASVVYDHIDGWTAIDELPPERRRSLIPYKYLYTVSLESATTWIYVYSVNMRTWPEIVTPHLHASTASHTDFDYEGRLFAKTAEVFVVDLEVVSPLEDARPLRMFIEEGLQLIL